MLIFEHGVLYNMEGRWNGGRRCRRNCQRGDSRAGTQISLITYGGTLFKTLQAADELARDGIDAEVVDLRTLRPLDTATIVDSDPAHASGRHHRRGLGERQHFRRDHGADHGKRFLRSRRPGGARLQRRSADALSETP